MLVREFFSGNSMLARNRINHVCMVTPQLRCRWRRYREIKVKVQERPPSTRQPLVVPNEVGIVSCMRDGHMQRLVRFGHDVEVATVNRLHINVIRLLNTQEVSFRPVQRCKARHCTLDEVQRRHILREFVATTGACGLSLDTPRRQTR